MSSSRDPGLVDVDSRGAGRCIHRRGGSRGWQAKGVPGVSQPKPLLARTSSPQQVGATACASHAARVRRRWRCLALLLPGATRPEQRGRALGPVETHPQRSTAGTGGRRS